MNTLSIRDLTLVYKNKTRAIDNLSLEIANGMFGLLGPNGAGKSSLMKMIVGLQKPTSGSILFNNISVQQQPSYLKKQLGFLPQDFGVYPKVSAWQLLEHLAILKGLSNKSERRQQMESLLHKVNLYDNRNKEVNSFSGGMKQRFGVAQALLGNPSLIIVDEPTAGLDPEERNRFNALLAETSKDIIIILSTHLVEDVRNLCSTMAILKNGRLAGIGEPAKQVAILDNKLWTKQIAAGELEKYQSQYIVISRQFIERELFITAFAENQLDGFSPITPTLEHYYFYTLNHAG